MKPNPGGEEKFAIISGDIHKLVKVKDIENSNHMWLIHEERDYYWVPVQNWNRDGHIDKRHN